MKGLKNIWNEFKKFITRGNVLDLAVGVVIGAAFTAIVTSLTNDIIMPLINLAVGDGDITSLCTILKEVYTVDADGNKILDTANSLIINWGTFIQAILDFILIAIVVFAIVKIINTVRDAGNKFNKQAQKDKEIRKLKKKFIKQGVSAEEAQAKAEEQYASDHAPAPAAPAKPTVEKLLTEIRNLLAENAKGENTEGDTAKK